jgi:hypothetical protein
MSDKAGKSPREAMEREKARRLEELAAKQAAVEAIDRDMAEMDRLAALAEKYGFVVTPAAKPETALDGAVSGLVDCYKAHPKSGYSKLAYRTRESYNSSLRRITLDLGPERIANLDRDRLDRVHADWIGGGQKSMGHALIGMLRILAAFGWNVLKDQDCRALRMTLHDMRIPKGEKQTEPLTEIHANKIRATARQVGYGSIALAQAIQFESKLGQFDVVGQWLPVSEAGTSDITVDGLKWVRGLRWNEIDENLVLRRAGKNQKPFDLKTLPMTAEELRAMFCPRGEALTRARLPLSGPVIKYESNGLPYQSHQFRRVWRMVADAAGVPKNVKNRDSRAGGESPLFGAAAMKAGAQGPG